MSPFRPRNPAAVKSSQAFARLPEGGINVEPSPGRLGVMIRLALLFLALALGGCAVNYHFDSPDAGACRAPGRPDDARAT